MTIDEAIAALTKDLRDPVSVDYDWRAKAQELGIEALRAIKTWRTGYTNMPLFQLPGETEEVK